MQKLPVSTFSATQKDALLDQVKIIIDAGEVSVRSDSSAGLRRSRQNLRLDDWKRLGRNQMGKPCGRGWVGLRGACKRGKKSDDNTEKIKASKVALADRIRARKGMRDRNAPKVEKKPTPKGKTTLNLARGDYGREGFLTTEVHTGWTNGYLAKLSTNKDKEIVRSFISASDKETSRAGNGQKHYKLSSLDDGIYEAETVVRSGIKERHYLRVKDGTITNKFNDINEAEDDEFPSLKADRQKLQASKRQNAAVTYGELTGSEKQVSWASGLRDKGSKQVLDELSSFPDSPEKKKAIDSVNEFVKSKSASRDWIDNRDRLGSWIKKGASEKASERSDSLHLDTTEVTRYTRAIDRLNAQYGWHLDAQKVLSRLGKRLGKKCGGGWISPEKKCKSHYTNGKLNSSGKASGANLADRVRSRKKMSTIASRDGKLSGGSWDIGAAYRSGKETQSTVLAKRTSPGGKKTSPMTDRVSKMQRVEADRARINWGRTTGDWGQKPDSTAAMDMGRPKLPSVEAIEQKWAKSFTEMVDPTPIASGKSTPSMEDGTPIKRGQDVWLSGFWDGGEIQKKTVVGMSRDGKTVTLRPTKLNEDQARRIKTERKNNLYDRKYPTDMLTPSRKAAESQKKDVADRKASIDRQIYERRLAEIAPVRIPNQRSSSEPRRRGRSVD